jgi:ATP-dependent RNA helicase SUPV3L1/SUV3
MALSRAFREKGVQTSVIYGDLPPEVRRAQYARFLSGQSPVLVATDAIGMGVNLPIRRIVFTDVEKYDGNIRRPLSTQEVKQIAGRAGRIGIYDTGYVGALDQEEADFIAYQLQAEDEPVRQAVVGPSEAILEIPLLPLQEKLALWSTRGESLPYYRKKDLRDELLILELLKPYALPESVEWQLMRVPFDLENDVLPVQFDAYVKERFVQGRSELTKPQPVGQTRTDLETYYQQISLYYACSKAMGLPVDQPWVLESRERVSRKIQALLERL